MFEITAKEVEEKYNRNESIHLIDVREEDEVAAGKIPGAINIPLPTLKNRMKELDKSVEYILVCRSGARSDMARNILAMEGYRSLNMVGGMLDWQGPVE